MTEIIKNPLHRFRMVALFEGISFLLIFGVSLPLKYIFEIRTLPYIIGMSHGVLFLLYIILAITLISARHVSAGQFGRILIASIIPFGTFFNDRMLKEQQMAYSEAKLTQR
ncbi:MAG: DUF3817 domain-containing protein [Alphaproteobacteria bacterium]|nr:DUF3817 domain-containing protein [Alphaproteobacteria bacterium]